MAKGTGAAEAWAAYKREPELKEQIKMLEDALHGEYNHQNNTLSRCQEAIEAARTIRREALEEIRYHARTNIDTIWRERWPWLEE